MKLFELNATILDEFPDYVIIEDGNIYDMKKRCFVKGHTAGNGYCKVQLRGMRHPQYLHRLIARAFVTNPNNFPQVDHIDNNKQNNCASNLQWMTAAQNTAKSRNHFIYERDGKKPKAIKAVIHDETSFEKETCFDLTNEFDEPIIFKSIIEAARCFGLNHKSVSFNLQGVIKLLSVPYKGETLKIHFEVVPSEERKQKKLF